MFICEQKNKYYQITFNIGILDKNYEDILYEDNLISINKRAIEDFCEYFKIVLSIEPLKIKIRYSDFLTEISVLENKSKTKDYIRARYKQNELSACFFKKDLYPEHFSLKPYQNDGINWLLKKKGRLLADDMGLGKTAQAIVASTLLIRNAQIKSVLIVCPRSLMQNWADELEVWAQSFKCYMIQSSANTEELWKGVISHGHFFIINYDQARKIAPSLLLNTPELIICDEAHKLRKKTSLVHNGLKEISKNAKRFWALTGTPIEKNVDDLISIMQLVRPNAYNSSVRKLSPITVKGMMMRNVLRRLKVDVLKDLSDLNEQTIYVRLNDKQQKAYDRTLKKINKNNKSEILKIFNDLRIICDDFNGQSSKFDCASDLLEKIKAKNEKVVIFSYTLNPLKEMLRRIESNFGRESGYLFEGKMDISERNEVISKFKKDPNTFSLLCSGKIAGEGLNLTEANNVIFLNEWWNPSSNNQARDRVHRIGQTKNVSIFNIRTKNTVEESLDNILKEKKEITNDVIEAMVLRP